MKKILLSLFLLGCGTEPPPAGVPSPNPGPGPIPTPDKPDFNRMTALHQQYCIQCHANSAFIRDETALKNSSAKIRVRNGTMPPNPAAMPNNAREEYLSFFSG